MITVDVRRLTASTPLRGSGARVLDAGCGSGRHVGEAYRLAKAVVIGVDRDAADLSEAAARMQVHDRLGEHGGGTWALGAADILDLPFKNGCFDVVICSEVLEHIPDHRRAIREVLRVLKQGGSLAVSVPRTYPEKICWALSPDYRRSPGGHVRIYRKEKLVHLVEKAGARLLGTHFAHSLHNPLLVAQMSAGAQWQAERGRGMVPPLSGMGHDVTPACHTNSRSAAQPRPGQEHRVLFQKSVCPGGKAPIHSR